MGAVVVILLTSVFGTTFSCLGLIIALKTKSVQATQASFVLFIPFIFLSAAFMPRELLSGWFQVAVAINPVNYVMEGIRVIVIEGWVWKTILTGLVSLVAMSVVLTAGATWLYRRATA